MEKEKKYTVEVLNTQQVRIVLEEIIRDGDKAYKSDELPMVVSYVNSPKGRENFQGSDFPENIKNAVFAMWGDEPTVEEPKILERLEKHDVSTMEAVATDDNNTTHEEQTDGI